MLKSIRTALFLTAAFGTAALAAPAQAKWETAHGFPNPLTLDCSAVHTKNPQLRETDGRPFDVPAGFVGEIEIYGQLIDLSKVVAVSGLTGVTATISRTVAGPLNFARSCGAIGSIVIKLDVKRNIPKATGSLQIGGDSFPLRVVNAAINRTAWSEATIKAGRGANVGTPGTPNPAAILTGGPTTLPEPDYPAGIGECIDDFGGKAEFNANFASSPTILTITLPQSRTSDQIACLIRPALFQVSGTNVQGDVGGPLAPNSFPYPGFSQTLLPPRYQGSTSGLTGPAPLPAPAISMQIIALTRDTAASFVGERQIALTSATTNANPLTLVLRSVPYNGIRSIQGVPFNGARIASAFDVRFDFLAAFRGPESVAWRIAAVTGASPLTCFTAASGTLTATAAIGRLPLTATEAAGCTGSRFTLQIAPAINGAGLFAAPFVQSVTFTLPARSLPVQTLLPPQRITVPPR